MILLLLFRIMSTLWLLSGGARGRRKLMDLRDIVRRIELR